MSVVTAVAIGMSVGISAATAQAIPGTTGPDGVAQTGAAPAATVSSVADRLARRLATSMAGEARLFAAAADGPVTLAGSVAGPALDRAVRQADHAVLAAKGLPAGGPSLLQLRLAHPDMRAALDRGEAPLVAAAPTDDAPAAVTAYDRTGAAVPLDATRMPRRPVFVVEVDPDAAVPAGLDVLRATLAARGITGATPATPGTGGAGIQAGYWATQVRAVRLTDDEEPWIKGAAEIFGIASGFGLDGHVKVDTVTMPYLDYDGTTYYPNQLIVHFSAYKYNLADFVMMEDDGDTNYQALAIALADALLTIVDGGAYIPLVNAILNAMPNSWWTDDPDYVDSWYTLSTTSSGRHYGARANGWMDLAPYWVQQF